MANGSLVFVTVMLTYLVLAGQSPQADTPDPSALRAAGMQAKLWSSLVESAFLTASGIGLARFREWARTLFLALAIVHTSTLLLEAWGHDLHGSPPEIAFALLRDALLYGAGVWYLTRRQTIALFSGGLS
jgi:hypothetical protein